MLIYLNSELSYPGRSHPPYAIQRIKKSFLREINRRNRLYIWRGKTEIESRGPLQKGEKRLGRGMDKWAGVVLQAGVVGKLLPPGLEVTADLVYHKGIHIEGLGRIGGIKAVLPLGI